MIVATKETWSSWYLEQQWHYTSSTKADITIFFHLHISDNLLCACHLLSSVKATQQQVQAV